MSFQKTGGLAALLAAATYIVGFYIYFAVLGPANYGSPDTEASQHVMFLMENQILMHVWNLVIFTFNAILMVFISLALYHRTKNAGKALAQSGTVFGLIWAGFILASGMVANIGIEAVLKLAAKDMNQAVGLWYAMTSIEEGIGGGNEITGGLWILLISLAGQRSRSLPISINALGIFIGAAGVLTMIPALIYAEIVFGLGFIIWFFCIGFTLLFNKKDVSRSEV
jgi:hypothetical protein